MLEAIHRCARLVMAGRNAQDKACSGAADHVPIRQNIDFVPDRHIINVPICAYMCRNVSSQLRLQAANELTVRDMGPDAAQQLSSPAPEQGSGQGAESWPAQMASETWQRLSGVRPSDRSPATQAADGLHSPQVPWLLLSADTLV